LGFIKLWGAGRKKGKYPDEAEGPIVVIELSYSVFPEYPPLCGLFIKSLLDASLI